MTKPNLTKGIYYHHKGAKYQLLDVVQHSETQEWLVLYKALYGDYGLWVRPLTMFTEQVNTEQDLVPRFKLTMALEKN